MNLKTSGTLLILFLNTLLKLRNSKKRFTKISFYRSEYFWKKSVLLCENHIIFSCTYMTIPELETFQPFGQPKTFFIQIKKKIRIEFAKLTCSSYEKEFFQRAWVSCIYRVSEKTQRNFYDLQQIMEKLCFTSNFLKVLSICQSFSAS